VYRGLQRMIERNITESAALLLDCIATFSCNEICTYQEFIVYAIMTNLLKLSRPLLKEKILDGPEVLSVARDIPIVVSTINVADHRNRKTA
jgi:26S proteasome regulatory subunit N7